MGSVELAAMKQPWKTQTVSDRNKERKVEVAAPHWRPLTARPALKREGSRRSRSRSRSPRGRAARSRSPERSRRPQSHSTTTHSVEPAQESKAQLCREQREQTRQARRREEREEAERKGGSGQGGSTSKENSSRTSGGSLPVCNSATALASWLISPAVRPAATPTIALHYFDIQGPAEPARLALVVGGVPFEDVRYDRERMLKAKEAGELPYGQLPLLYVDGKCLAQSLAISEWCARQAGLVPADSFEQVSSYAVMRHATPHSSTPCTHYTHAEQAKIFEVVQYISQDVRERVIAPTMREPDAAKKAAQRKMVNDETRT